MKKRKFSNKISVNILFTVIFCFFLSISISLIAMRYMSFYYYYVAINYNNLLYYNLIMISIIIMGIGIFVLSFLLILNKKINYIKYITKGVKIIADEDFGRKDEDFASKIEVKGTDELAQLSNSINSMSIKLKNKFDNEREIENTKNELITNMSHDLRSPLTSVIGYADLIRKKGYKDENQLHEFSEIIYKKCERLNKLIDELFEYTKLNSEAVQLNYSEVNLNGLLSQLTGEYIPTFDQAGLTIHSNLPKEDVIVNVDIEKIVRVFDNILINSKKYSIKPSEILVELQERQGSALVSISNKIKNLPVENLEKLFERFYRVDKSRSDDGSAGLGLAIAKKIVELHKGKIWAEYKDNTIKFNVELPISKWQ